MVGRPGDWDPGDWDPGNWHPGDWQPEDWEVVRLLQALIRNRCVNDGNPGSGHESANANLISELLTAAGAEIETFEPLPGRVSLVARIEGNDPKAPSLCFLGHTDVVPVNEARWSRDPFGGELSDGVVWGRGAVDMLNLTSAMVVAFARLARRGFRPKGTLVLAAVADEEALGSHGAGWLVDHAGDAVKADYVVTEGGGVPFSAPAGKLVLVPVAEKGAFWCRLRVNGEASHASMPLRTDNALVTAAELVRRLATWSSPAQIHTTWRRLVESMGFPAGTERALLDPGAIDAALETMDDLGLARQAHACTHMTVTPTIVRGGTKINVVPDAVELEVDVRALPGQSEQDVRELLGEAIGDLAAKVEIVEAHYDPPSSSSVGTPLWASMEKLTSSFHPGAKMVPHLMSGATDARFFRSKGACAYGFGVFSEMLSYEQFIKMFHGDYERVDVQSLTWSAAAYERLAADFLS